MAHFIDGNTCYVDTRHNNNNNNTNYVMSDDELSYRLYMLNKQYPNRNEKPLLPPFILGCFMFFDRIFGRNVSNGRPLYLTHDNGVMITVS